MERNIAKIKMFKFLRKKLDKFGEQIELEVKKAGKREDEEGIDDRVEKELRKSLQAKKEMEKIAGKMARFSISQKKLDELLWDLEMGLLQADVAMPVVEEIKENVKEGMPSIGRKNAGEVVKKALRDTISRILSSNKMDFDEFIKKSKKPVVIMSVGVNGTGKTTAIAKLAYQLQKDGKSCVIAAGDTFRAGAIEQLEEHARRVGVKLIKHSQGADPAAVAYDAIQHAGARGKDVVLVDTAGRMQTNVNLMDEMGKIKRVAKPDMILFVGDALAGNDAIQQARKFDEVVGIDGIILTKVDADAKGGAALSIAYTIGKPLLFIGIGQGYDDQVPFDSDWMVEHIFGD